MASVDAAWFRMDRPGNTADVVSLMTFRELPPMDAIERLVRERLLAFSRFRQRAIRGAALGRDRWEDDPGFELERHLVRRRLTSASPEALRELVSAVASEPLTGSRPLWQAHLVERPGGAALVSKLHHCVADGFALIGLLLTLADEPGDAPESRNAAEAFARLAPWLDPAAMAREVLGDPARALRLGADAAGLALSLGRMAALGADPPTQLSRPPSGRRRVAWSAGLPLAAIREAGLARGATINDVILAAVSGALRGWLASTGARGVPVRAMVPVSLRPGPPRTDGELGNRFGLVFLDLATDGGSPRERLEAMRERCAVAKRRPDALASLGVLAALGALPGFLVPWVSSFFSRKASVVVTNVAGPRQHLHVAGRRVENAMFWVPHPSTLGLGISVLTYAGEVRLGVRADEAVMREPAELVTLFEEELAALGAAAPARSAAG
jgi:diacylglycerol O-acyltransferase